MIMIPGDSTKGLSISRWLKENGLVHSQDYTWYQKSRDKTCAHDRVVFEFKNPSWESMTLMRWS
jgi:hypothetical protein